MTAPSIHTRNADLGTLVQILKEGQARKLDIVAPAGLIKSVAGDIVVSGTEVQLTEDGVTTMDGVYRPTAICDGQLAERLMGSGTASYLGRLRGKHIELFDQNINGWLQHPDNAGKNFLVRCLRSDDSGHGVARAFLSDSYKPIDNLDVLMTVLEGINAAGVKVEIAGADLSDRRMYVRFVAPEVQALAPTLLKNYRSPFTGASGTDNPVVFAGFEVSNSEVGHGAFSIMPRLEVQVCKNGMVINAAKIRAQHLGQRLEVGEIKWSEDTQEKNLALIKAKSIDAIKAMLDPEWLQGQIDAIEKLAGTEVTKPEATIKVVAQKLRYTEAQQEDILKMFIKGGDTTAGGVMNAVTASAQNQTDADVAADMERDALRVLELAVAAA